MMVEEKLEILTREEFFKLFPPETRGLKIESKEFTTFIPMGEEIICDLCNSEVTGDIGIYAQYALCEECTKKVARDIIKKK